MFTHPDKVEWRTVRYLISSDAGPREDHTYEYKLKLPSFLASWDVWDYWERERVHSMRAHLGPDDVLWDVGAESGWCSIIYARLVGPSHLVLIEPTPEFWPNIKATWLRNHGYRTPPRACYQGLLSDRDAMPTDGPWPVTQSNWPEAAYGDLIERTSYRYIHEHADTTAQLRADHLADLIGPPTALTIDVEGAELLVLRGAERILQRVRPKVWVSVHPDLALRDYGTTTDELMEYVERFGYRAEHLATDHETHYYFEPRWS
jgi:FkbM family methyltransferase